MTWWLVLWINTNCPGGLFSGFIPGFARPLLCSRQQDYSIFSSQSLAVSKIREVGQGARLVECRGLRCSERRIIWKPVIE